jgi:PAS domain S-box-containing protein
MGSKKMPKNRRSRERGLFQARLRHPKPGANRTGSCAEDRTISGDLYEAIKAQSFDGVCIFNLETMALLDSNDRLLNMLGYSKSEIEGMTLSDLLADEGHLKAVVAMAERVASSRVARGLCRHKDGSMVDVESTSGPVDYPDGPAFLLIIHDVTEHKRLEKELEFRAIVMQDQAELLDTAEDAIMVRDLEDRIIFWNRGAQERYGWTKEQALDRTVPSLLKTESRRPFEELKAELFAKGSLTEELTHITREGVPIVVESRWTLRKDKHGRPLAILEINNDITQRKLAEKTLQQAKEQLELRVAERTEELQGANERLSVELERRGRVQEMLRKAAERYKNLFDNSPIGIYRTGPDGRILMANPSLFRMMGYSSSNTLASLEAQKGLYEPTYLRKRFLNRLRRDGRVQGFEAVWRRPDRSNIFVRENARVTRAQDGTVLYFEGTVEDISARKKAEEDIHSYQQQLRSLAAELSLTEERERRRIATILHDHIGQILAMSKIKLGSLIQSSPSSADVGSVREIREYVEQAIDYTRSLTVELSPPVLYAFGLEAALEWLSEQIAEQFGIDCRFENDSEPKPVSEEMKVFTFTAVRELLANVVKHAKASRAKVTVRRVNRSLVIHVADDGVGFNPSKLRTHLYDNQGFGLFSIRERIRHLGGQMEVKSIKGRGTRVILEEPLAN